MSKGRGERLEIGIRGWIFDLENFQNNVTTLDEDLTVQKPETTDEEV